MAKRSQSAMIPAPAAAAVGSQALTGAVLCAVSLVASGRPMAIDLPKLPKISVPNVSLPKLGDIDLPNFGKKEGKKPAKNSAQTAPRVRNSNVKVRAARSVVPTDSTDAPTLAEITGQQSQESISAGDGFLRYPERRMPGANMDGWKKIAKDIAPKI